jgi:hypothetical protein
VREVTAADCRRVIHPSGYTTLEPLQNAPQRPTDDAEARQTQYEYQKAYRALHQAEERLEMYGRPDMAREVRTIRSRLALGR